MSYSLRVGASAKKMSLMSAEQLIAISKDSRGQLGAFNKERYIPIWIPLVYLVSNFVLNSLNIYWFGKMIQTIRTRFEPPFGTKGVGPDKIAYQPELDESEDSDLGIGEPGKSKEHKHHPEGVASDRAPPEPENKAGKGSVKAARQRAEEALNGPVGTVADSRFDGSSYEDSNTGAVGSGTQRRSARSRRKA